MRKLLCSVAVCIAALSLSSCLAGPHQLRRSVDDWDQQMYTQNPWLNGILWWPVPLFGLATWGAAIGDFFVDGYHFWAKDAWDMKGTGFKHADITAEDGEVHSLLGGGEFLKVHK